MIKLFEDGSDRRAEVVFLCAEQVADVYMDPGIEDSNTFIARIQDEKPIGVDVHIWGTFASLQIDLMVDGILRNSKTLVKKGPKKDTKKFQFRSGFVKNQHGSFVEGTMWSKSFDCTPLKKTSGGSMGSLEIVISIARTEDEPTHTSADPNVFGHGAQAEEYDGMIPRQNISFARLGEQLTTYSLTKLKHRGIERRPGVEVWRRVKFLYRTEAGIKSAGLDPISVIIRRFVLPPYVALRKEPDPDEPRQRLAKPDEKEKPKSDPEAGGKNNVDMEGVSALLGSSITRQLTSETNAFTTSFATQVRKVNVEQSDNSAPVSTAQDSGPAASSGTALTPILRILPQAVPPAQLSTNLAVNTPAMTDIQNDSFVQGTATPSHVPSSYGSASAGVEHEARVASTTKPTTLPLPTGQNESEPEQTLDLQTHAGESAISPLNSGQKRHASVSTELRVKKAKMEESDLSNASLARQLWGKRAARKEKERQLAEMKARFAEMIPQTELEDCILQEELLDSAVAAELAELASFMDELNGDRAARWHTPSPSFASKSK